MTIKLIFYKIFYNIIIFHFQKLKYSFINYIKIFYVNKIKKKKFILFTKKLKKFIYLNYFL